MLPGNLHISSVRMKHYSLLDIFASVRGTAYAFDPETGEYVRGNFAVTITPRGGN